MHCMNFVHAVRDKSHKTTHIALVKIGRYSNASHLSKYKIITIYYLPYFSPLHFVLKYFLSLLLKFFPKEME